MNTLKVTASFLFVLILINSLNAQQNYNAFYNQMNPTQDSMSFEKSMEVLDDFLQKAIEEKDTIRIIHGHMYLSNQYYVMSDFFEATKQLLEAEKYANAQNNSLLLGRISHQRGLIFTVLRNYEEAIEQFEKSLDYSSAEKDSQNIAITYEQIGAVYGYMGKYTKAYENYEIALPLVKRFCSKNSLAVTLANFGNVLSNQDSVEGAIKIYQKAISIYQELGEVNSLVPSMQNLAGEYLKINKFEEALELYYKCLKLNRENGWKHYLIYTYQGISAAHNDMGIKDSALIYYKYYHELKDSIIGTEVQNEIGNLESEIEVQNKEIELLKQKEITALQKRRNQMIIVGFSSILILSGIGIWILYLQRRKDRIRLREHRESLTNLTKILQKKNAEIRDRQTIDFVPRFSAQHEDKLSEINPYELKILTSDDWIYFKTLFEKSYPRFLTKLRKDYEDISEAEERLFLLIKLKLNSREIADILGIQPDSVKRTRNRLRKRLKLETEDSLEQFIQTYEYRAQLEWRSN